MKKTYKTPTMETMTVQSNYSVCAISAGGGDGMTLTPINTDDQW